MMGTETKGAASGTRLYEKRISISHCFFFVLFSLCLGIVVSAICLMIKASLCNSIASVEDTLFNNIYLLVPLIHILCICLISLAIAVALVLFCIWSICRLKWERQDNICQRFSFTYPLSLINGGIVFLIVTTLSCVGYLNIVNPPLPSRDIDRLQAISPEWRRTFVEFDLPGGNVEKSVRGDSLHLIFRPPWVVIPTGKSFAILWQESRFFASYRYRADVNEIGEVDYFLQIGYSDIPVEQYSGVSEQDMHSLLVQ